MNTDKLFATLGRVLEAAIPKAIARAKVPVPLWSVRLYYYDTHAPCAYLFLGTISTAQRDATIAARGSKAPLYLWSSADTKTDGPRGLCLPSDQPPPWSEFRLGRLFSKLYNLLGDDEEAYMTPYREMLQRVARNLNTAAWPGSCQTTDDFTVLPADGSQYFADDWPDIIGAVPSDKLQLLRSRCYLGSTDSTWDHLD